MKILTLILICNIFIFAQELTLKYKVKFGLFGTGEAVANILESKDEYKIELTAKTRGFLKTITAGRIEKYTSLGKIKDSIFIPDFYIKSRENSFKTKRDTYLINHFNKKVDIKKERIENKGKNETFFANLKFYSTNDILTLIFNIKNMLDVNTTQNFIAIGANKVDGKIEIKSHKENENIILNISVKEKSLDKLTITLDKDFIPIKAVLEDVELFGDVVAKLTKKEVK